MQIQMDLSLSEVMKIRGGLLVEMIKESNKLKKLRKNNEPRNVIEARQQYENDLCRLYNKFVKIGDDIINAEQ